MRRWIGVAVWRWLHRWTLAVYVLGIAHTLGSGTDARSAWLLGLLAADRAADRVRGHLPVPATPSAGEPRQAPGLTPHP